MTRQNQGHGSTALRTCGSYSPPLPTPPTSSASYFSCMTPVRRQAAMAEPRKRWWMRAAARAPAGVPNRAKASQRACWRGGQALGKSLKDHTHERRVRSTANSSALFCTVLYRIAFTQRHREDSRITQRGQRKGRLLVLVASHHCSPVCSVEAATPPC